MSLKSIGVGISISHQGKSLARGFHRVDPKEALKDAVEAFSTTKEFKTLTETGLYGDLDVRLSFLVHTSL